MATLTALLARCWHPRGMYTNIPKVMLNMDSSVEKCINKRTRRGWRRQLRCPSAECSTPRDEADDCRAFQACWPEKRCEVELVLILNGVDCEECWLAWGRAATGVSARLALS